MLHAFVLVDAEKKSITIRDYLRAAYMAKFCKDITPNALEEDLRTFQEKQVLPKYLIDFAIKRIG